MAVPEGLSDKLREALGHEAGVEMVDWMRRVDEQRAELRDLNELFLARMKAQFGEVDLKFEQMGRRLDEMGRRFEQLNQRFEQVDQRFQQMDERLQRVEGRLDEHDKRFDKVDAQIADVRRDLEVGFARIDGTIHRRFSDVLKWAIVFWVGSVIAMGASVAGLTQLLT